MSVQQDVLKCIFGAIDLKAGDLKDPKAIRVDAVPGDHITAEVSESEFWHHGIYIGQHDGLGLVVEMIGKTAEDTSTIQVRPLQDFGRYHVVKYSDSQSTADALKDSIKRASCLAQASNKDPSKLRYHIVKVNCETLAILCRTGIYMLSPQVRVVLNKVHDTVQAMFLQRDHPIQRSFSSLSSQ